MVLSGCSYAFCSRWFLVHHRVRSVARTMKMRKQDQGKTIWTCWTCGKKSTWKNGWTHFGPSVWCSEECFTDQSRSYQKDHPKDVLWAG